MNVILDECLPHRLIRDLAEAYPVTTVSRQGWGGCSDKELVRRIPEAFDVWITMDSKLRFQHRLEDLPVGVIVLRARNNRYETLKELVPKILECIPTLAHGQVVELRGDPEPQTP